MQYRQLGRTGWNVSTVSFGAWAIGGAWGTVEDQDSLAALERAIDLGVNFIDTADVYGDGRSERLIAEVRQRRSEEIYVATKAGRRLLAQTVEGYNLENLTTFVERSLKNLATEAIDLLQLHCPPTQVYYRPEVFGILDDLVDAGKLRYYGVSVSTPEEGLKALDYPNLQSVQIIYNMFRHRPAEIFLNEAKRRQVGVLARVPLASGLLTGKMRLDTKFEPTDHREFNRHGEKFDQGETFSGVDFEAGLQAVEELRALCPAGWTLTQFALRWILTNVGVTCAIPGAKRPQQAEDNCAAADLPPLDAQTMAAIRRIYDERIRSEVHYRW
ncbi:MAG TPA: aldo/keto reductase [Lacipirellulaceae bacterium]|nr:aldo/keto reductase [Lacipirellulaceae bacterium]